MRTQMWVRVRARVCMDTGGGGWIQATDLIERIAKIHVNPVCYDLHARINSAIRLQTVEFKLCSTPLTSAFLW